MFQHQLKQKQLAETGSSHSSPAKTGHLLSVIVCSENKSSLSLLTAILQRVPGLQVSLTTYTTAELADVLKKHAAEFDILFADINQLGEKPLHDISTYSAALQVVAFGEEELRADNKILPALFGYLRVPFLLENILSVINSIRQFNQGFQIENMIARKNFILIKYEYKLIKTNLSDIFFIAGMKDYTQIYLKGKVTPLTTLQNLKEFEKKLPADDFVRVHRSYIIAVQYIDCISRNEILIGNHSIPVGDAFRNSLNVFIEAYT